MKKSFVLYLDQYSSIKKLSDEQAGMLLKAMFEFNLGNNFEIADPVVDLAFSFLGETFKRDSDKYLKICAKNKENARIRWDKRNATASDRILQDAKNADSDSDTIVIVTEDSDKKKKKKKKKENIPPSFLEVSEYCTERKNGIDPQHFINHYESNGWIRGKNKIKSWKACIRTWEGNSVNKNNNSQSESWKTAL